METELFTYAPACIGCGYCCATALCAAGLRIYPGAGAPCPALQWNGERHVCDLMTKPGDIGARYRKALDAGVGCCSSLNSYRTEPLQDRTITEELPKAYVSKEVQCLIVALARQGLTSDALWLTLRAFEEQLTHSGYTAKHAEALRKECEYFVSQNRDSRFKEFMG